MLNCAVLVSLAVSLGFASYVGFAMFFPPFAFRICFFRYLVQAETGEPGHLHSPVSKCPHKAGLRRDQVMRQTLLRLSEAIGSLHEPLRKRASAAPRPQSDRPWGVCCNGSVWDMRFLPNSADIDRARQGTRSPQPGQIHPRR